METGVYEGSVFHGRTQPRVNAFTYKVCMWLIDLDELQEIDKLSWFFSTSTHRPIYFNQNDYFVFENTKPGLDLKSRIQGYVSEQAGFSPVRIKLLCNPRYWGQKMNPLVCAYCYDEKQILRAIVAEVSNTPWNQRHCYLIPVEHQSSDTIIDKRFTVSPFNHLNMCYHWKSNPPQENHSIAIDVYEKNNRESAVLNTALMLKKQTLSGRVCRKIALNYPFHTLKVISLIYFQALKLLLKKVPFLGKDKYKSLEPE